jgi:hypothetical protein
MTYKIKNLNIISMSIHNISQTASYFPFLPKIGDTILVVPGFFNDFNSLFNALI